MRRSKESSPKPAETKNGDPQPPRASREPGDLSGMGSALPADVALELIEAERDFLAGKVHEVEAVSDRLGRIEVVARQLQEAVSPVQGLSALAQANAEGLRRIEDEVARVREAADRMPEGLRRLEDEVASERRRIDGVTGEVEGERRRIDSLAEGIRRLEGEVASVRQGLDRLHEDGVRHLARCHQEQSGVKVPARLRWPNLRNPREWREIHRASKDYEALAGSPLFDRKWYLTTHPDVAAAGMDPVLHYLRHGADEGRAPGPDFDGPEYLRANPDVAAAGMNPLVHFLRHGAYERRPLRRSGAPGEAAATPPAERRIKSTPRLWHFLGDTISWLKDHPQLTGVGRVSTELFFASLQLAPEITVLPCVFGDSASRLIEVPLAEQVVHLSRRTGRRPTDGLKEAMYSRSPTMHAPEPGDHVFFTGLVWTPTFTKTFKHLSASGIEFSVLVHDIIPIESPDLAGTDACRSFSEWLGTTVNTASVIYVSNALVHDKIIRWALLSGLEIRAKIVPISFGVRKVEGAPDSARIASDPRTAKIDVNGFVLSVGTIDQRKNQAFLCRLWERLVDVLGSDETPQLVLAGRDDLRIAKSDPDIAALAAKGKILVLEGLSDQQVAGLYQACLFTAFPSLNEGYGLPVAESLRYGKLCLSTELPEIQAHARDLCWYFSPADPDGTLELFVRGIRDVEARTEAEARIVGEFHPVEWVETCRDMIRAADAALREPPPGSSTHGVHRPCFPGARSVDPNAALARVGAWCTDADPEVSILVINWNATSPGCGTWGAESAFST
jgi:glycosyltransferase involved in cell wall biosynthesis